MTLMLSPKNPIALNYTFRAACVSKDLRRHLKKYSYYVPLGSYECLFSLVVLMWLLLLPYF